MRTFICAVVASAGLAVGVTSSVIAAGNTPMAAAMSQAKSPEETLKDRVSFQIETNPAVRKYDIRVKVDAGVAVLSGAVATAAQKAEAEKVAKVDGITRVQNDIKVDPNADKSAADRIKGGLSKTGEKIDDAWISAKILWFIAADESLEGNELDVETKDGVATLKGTVKSGAGKTKAVELAKNTDGVKSVVDRIEIY